LDFISHSAFFLPILFLVSLLTGVIGSMGGPGGLIVTPFMIATGLHPQMAIGTTRISSIGMWVITIFKFKKADKIQWEYTPQLAVIALIGGVIGTSITLSVEDKWIYAVVGVAMLVITPLSFMNKQMGIDRRDTSAAHKRVGYFLYFLVSIFGGFFGGGAGLLAISTLVFCMGLRTLEAHATEIIPWVLLVVATSVLFIWNDQVNYPYVLTVFTGMALGGHFGSALALRKGDAWVKGFVGIFSLIVGARLLWNAWEIW